MFKEGTNFSWSPLDEVSSFKRLKPLLLCISLKLSISPEASADTFNFLSFMSGMSADLCDPPPVPSEQLFLWIALRAVWRLSRCFCKLSCRHSRISGRPNGFLPAAASSPNTHKNRCTDPLCPHAYTNVDYFSQLTISFEIPWPARHLVCLCVLFCDHS